MYRIMFVAIFTAITIGCLAGNTRESKSIDGADRLKSIEATGKWTINLIQSTKPSIKVEYPNTFSDKIIAEVRQDGTLYLGFNKNIDGITRKQPFVATVYVSNIDEIRLSGAADIKSSGNFAGNSCTIKLQGASDVKNFNFEGKELYVSLSGSSDCSVKGNVNTVQLSLSGSSDFEMNGKGSVVNVVASGSSDVKMSDFHTETLQVSISGSSDMFITISQKATGTLSGASSLRYRGDADISGIKTSGSSEVIKLNSR